MSQHIEKLINTKREVCQKIKFYFRAVLKNLLIKIRGKKIAE